jgi:glycerophosphoryl diester phosphodiesterase
VTSRRPIVVAHRAGNNGRELRAAEALGVDMVEADLHLFGGHVEVRHEKSIGPLPVFWERWRLVPLPRPRRRLAELLAEAQPETHLLLDLKGPFPRLSRRALAEVRARAPERSYTVCARNWLLLRPFSGSSAVTVVRSVAGPLQLRYLLLRRRLPVDGISINHDLLDERVARAVLARTSFLVAWGVTTGERLATLWGLGVTGFILDDPALMVAARKLGAPPA